MSCSGQIHHDCFSPLTISCLRGVTARKTHLEASAISTGEFQLSRPNPGPPRREEQGWVLVTVTVYLQGPAECLARKGRLVTAHRTLALSATAHCVGTRGSDFMPLWRRLPFVK